MIRLYTEKKFLREDEEYIHLLYPYWLYYPEADDFVDKGRFLEYTRDGGGFFNITDNIDNAEAVLSPIAYEKPRGKESALYFAELARKYDKKVIIFFNSDSTEEIPFDNAIIFRTSFYKSTKGNNEYALPGWSTDYTKEYFNGKLQLRKKHPIPTVGYCGYIDFKNCKEKLVYYIKRVLKGIPKKPACHLLRGNAVRFISKNKEIQTNFIIRNGFMGKMAQTNARKEYVDNIINSDYCLVARGGGNFSYRLYEVLSCGRIPVFINTDCVLPYDDFVDWKNYFIWVEEKDLKDIARIILDFHNRISDHDFQSLQIKIRELYEEWVNPVGFFKNLWRYIKV